MVITVGPAAGEGIAQPEIMVQRDPIGDVREGRRALVGGDNEIGVRPVADDDMFGMHHLAGDAVVGDRQQSTDENAIAFGAFGEPCVAVAGGIGQLLGIESALGPGRHDDRVLDPLRLHQPQHFGAEIIAPV